MNTTGVETDKTVIILGAGASVGSGYTRNGHRLPGDRGFFGNMLGQEYLNSGQFPAIKEVLGSFEPRYGRSLDSIGLEEAWTLLDFADRLLLQDPKQFLNESDEWLKAIRRPESRTDDEHCECGRFRAEHTIPPREVPLLLVLLTRVYDALSPPARNLYDALLETNDIPRDDHTAVMSLNYDTVLEHGLRDAGIPWYYPHVRTTKQRDPHGMRVLKPHGSLNWSFRGNEPPVEIGTDYRLSPIACRSEATNKFEEAMIIPPTELKQAITLSETQAPELTRLFVEIWRDSMEALSNAKRIFVIGYSFPQTDLHLRTMFHLAAHKRRRQYDEVICCTLADGQQGGVFGEVARLLPSRSFRLCDKGFEAFVSAPGGSGS